jgi:hypothetical protein
VKQKNSSDLGHLIFTSRAKKSQNESDVTPTTHPWPEPEPVRTVGTTETKAQLDAVDGTPLAIDDGHYWVQSVLYTATAILRVVTLSDSRSSKAFEP